jgi:hypothetical protein
MMVNRKGRGREGEETGTARVQDSGFRVQVLHTQTVIPA